MKTHIIILAILFPLRSELHFPYVPIQEMNESEKENVYIKRIIDFDNEEQNPEVAKRGRKNMTTLVDKQEFYFRVTSVYDEDNKIYISSQHICNFDNTIQTRKEYSMQKFMSKE